jgi:hypothetical protein
MDPNPDPQHLLLHDLMFVTGAGSQSNPECWPGAFQNAAF